MGHDDAFRLFFRGLARQGPGTDEATQRALDACDVPDEPVVYDLGAGTGASTLVLAEELGTKVIAVDRLGEGLKSLAERAERRGIGDLVETRVADFTQLDIEPGSVDVIWSEGAIYSVGWMDGLRNWRRFLRPGGYLVVSDCVWVTDDRPAEAEAFWEEEYPDMTTIAEHCDDADDAGFEVVETFALPDEAWEDYYGPLRQRMALVMSGEPSEEMRDVAESVQEEISMWETHGEAWDYVFFVLRRLEGES